MSRLNFIQQHLFPQQELAYFCVNHKGSVQEVSDNLRNFGFQHMQHGDDVCDVVDFMVGVDTHLEIDLPIVTSPDGTPLKLRFIPTNSDLTVVLSDASKEFKQQHLLQQKANENQLLLDTQDKLLAEIEYGKQMLQSKNDQLEEAVRLQSRFLSGVSHEFRTPLASIIGYAQLLQNAKSRSAVSKATAKPFKSDYAASILRSGKHLLSLIENILDHGKYESEQINLNPRATDLEELANDISLLIEPLANTKNIEFSFNRQNIINRTAWIDDGRLRQCMINVIGNAIKFTDIGWVRVTGNWSDDVLEIVVEDTGIGISNEHLNSVLQPFWQAPDTGKTGTGLGLTITDRIVELMGGSLTIQSIESGGARVSFTVLAPECTLQTVSHLEQIPVLPSNVKVLLAEDDDDVANLVTILLSEQGINVVRAQNGALAIEQLKAQSFDLVLMDLRMPVMDGHTAVTKLRDSGDATPVIIMTASASDADRIRADQLSCDGYLVKPVDLAGLMELFDQILNSDDVESAG